MRRKPSVRPALAILLTQSIAGAFLPLAQHRSQTSSQPPVRAGQARGMAAPEVVMPATEDGVCRSDNLAQAPPIGAPRQPSHFLPQLLQALLARPLLPPAKVPAQEIETLALRVDDARLGRMQGQSRLLAPLTQLRQRLLGFFPAPAQHHQVIRVAYHLVALPGHLLVQGVQIQVRQQRTDHGPLRGPALGRLPAFEFFQYSGLQTLLQQRQDAAVHHALLDQPEQPGVRDRVEVALEIQIHAPNASGSQKLFDPLYRFPASASGPKPVAVLGEVALEYRFKHVLQGRFHRPIPDRRYAQRPFLRRAGFGYPHPPRRLPVVASAPQFFPQLGQLGFGSPLELLHRLAIDSGGAVFPPHRPKGGLQIAGRKNFVPEPEPYGCRLALFEPFQHALRPNLRFHPPPSVVGFSGLWRRGFPRHSRRSSCLVLGHRRRASTFLHPLAPRALPRFLATMDALTPAGRFFGPRGHERPSVPGGPPCLSRTHFQPFCLQPPRHPSHGIRARSRLLSARSRTPGDRTSLPRPKELLLPGSWRELRSALAGSLVGIAESSSLCVMSVMSRRYGRVVHLRQLSTPCHHGAVAFGFRRVNVPPGRDFHPAVWAPSQAHERAAFPRFASRKWGAGSAGGTCPVGAIINHQSSSPIHGPKVPPRPWRPRPP